MNPENETTGLLRKAKKGNQEAYNRLFVFASDRLRLFLRVRLGAKLRQHVDSMDLLQDVYAEAHRTLDGFRSEEDQAFVQWLCRIGENRIRGLADHHGAQKRKMPVADLPVSQVLDQAKNSHTGPVTAAGRNEARDRLVQALESLEEEECEILLLRYFQNRTLDEIAELTEKSATSVRRILVRSLMAAGHLLQEGGMDGR